MNPIILSDNRFLDGVPTATDTDSAVEYSAIHIRDRRQFTHWKAANSGTKYLTVDCATAKSADALGITVHNLATASASVSVESSANGTDWTERLAAFTPTTNYSILKTFTTASARHWRIKIVTATVPAQIAVCMLGVRMTFPYPPDGPYIPADEGIEADVTDSKTGQFLGATYRFSPYTIKPVWSNDAVLRTFLDGTIAVWWASYARYLLPFFWAWDLSTYASDIRYVRLGPGYRYKPSFRVLANVDSFDLEMEGVKE